MVVPPLIPGHTLLRPLTLATDLDGTFAGGAERDRTRLQRILAATPGTTLIYITGRSVPATRALMAEAGLPHPDLLIADVGTTVRHGPELAPLTALETEIARLWPGGDAVRARLAGLAAIVEQEVRSPYRVSYAPVTSAHLAARSLPPAELPAELLGGEPPPNAAPAAAAAPLAAALEAARTRLAGLPVDLLGSAGIYLDVLPRGVNKGSTLRRTLRWLGRPDDEVLVAGDSMNDLALFQTGLAGVAVGNSEPELIARLAGLERVHLAGGHGAAGIIEALEYFGWLSKTALARKEIDDVD